jgi:4-hydroxy-tetrahydrodipicolinate synthase
MRALCDAARAGNVEAASRIDQALTALYELTGVEPNPIPVKWCLHLLGLGAPEPRLPLLTLSSAHRERAARVMTNLPGGFSQSSVASEALGSGDPSRPSVDSEALGLLPGAVQARHSDAA